MSVFLSAERMNVSTRVQTKHQIVDLLTAHARELRSRGVNRIGLFGSFARGEQHEQNDVDLLVQFHPEEKTFDNFIQFVFYLEDLLQRTVELVTTESLSPYIGPHILEETEYVSLPG